MAKNIVKRIDRNLARRLREARREVGLSVRAVSKQMPRGRSVSHTTVSNYEKGVTVPPIDVLAAMATIYRRPVNWFLDSRDTLTGFRYRNIQSRVPLADQRQYAAMAGKWAEAYFALEKHLRRVRPSLALPDIEGRSAVEVASIVRTEHLGLDDGQPVVDTIAVLESFTVWAIELRSTFGVDGAAAHLGKKPVVIMNPNVANERARLNAAYELAFVLLLPESTTPSTKVEQQAYNFASILLLPDSQLEQAFEGKSFLKLIQYKERFGVSLAAMIDRAESLRLVNTTASRWLRSEMAKRGWRRNEPGYVWRDRAITFETMLESAIQMKQMTWDEAERVTAVPQDELMERLAGVVGDENYGAERKEDEPATIRLFQ